MGADIPKQFITIGDYPVLMHTIQKFFDFDSNLQIILVLPDSEFSAWTSLCEEYRYNVPHELTAGGATRFDSVYNGLRKATGDLIAVHDGVRPFVANDVIQKCFEEAAVYGAAIPVRSMVESIREVTECGSRSVNRDTFIIVQTPQVFKHEIILTAYNNAGTGTFTDDASLVEAGGHPIRLVEGNLENIKITTPFDLKIATLLLSSDK